MRRRATATAVLALCAVGGGAVLAGAATVPKPVRATDARGDVDGALDLTRVIVARGSDGRLRVDLTLAEAFRPRDLRATSGGGVPGSLCTKVWASTVPPDQAPDFLVCATVDPKGKLRGSVLRERPNRLPERVAAADVSRPSSRTLRLRFAQSAILRPAAPRFQGEATAPGCDAVACVDTAPDAPKTLRLRLRAS
jgi:hypothetical protein